jgi:hypothetical protein
MYFARIGLLDPPSLRCSTLTGQAPCHSNCALCNKAQQGYRCSVAALVKDPRHDGVLFGDMLSTSREMKSY